MNPEKDREFEQNMNHLIWLLKKILKNIPSQGNFPQPPSAAGKEGSVNVNLCFFTFLPLPPEDYDEFEEIYDQYLMQEEGKGEEFTNDLNAADLDFLRRHGIKF